MAADPSAHSVSSHLRLDTAEYDRIIRTYIPYYEESRAEQLTLLEVALANRPAPRVIDLGGGTGSLAEAILDRFPSATVLVRDIDPAMLDVARQRLSRFGENRVTLDRASFADPLPPADAVVCAFALHHIPQLADKTHTYAKIHAALAPTQGVFLNNDAATGPFWPWLRDQWAVFMSTQGYTLAEGYGHLDSWAAEDTYYSVREELDSMHEGGFAEPECLWRRGPITILGARA